MQEKIEYINKSNIFVQVWPIVFVNMMVFTIIVTVGSTIQNVRRYSYYL